MATRNKVKINLRNVILILPTVSTKPWCREPSGPGVEGAEQGHVYKQTDPGEDGPVTGTWTRGLNLDLCTRLNLSPRKLSKSRD